MKSYNTADNLEDLNITEELFSFDGVCGVSENYQILEDEYKDADYYIWINEDAKVSEIEELLLPLGMKAYIEHEDGTITKIENE